jgi:hypothetical protein
MGENDWIDTKHVFRNLIPPSICHYFCYQLARTSVISPRGFDCNPGIFFNFESQLTIILALMPVSRWIKCQIGIRIK